MAPLQANRPMAVSSPLGEDTLLLRAMTLREPLGGLFEYDLELLSPDASIPFEQVIGENMTVRLRTRHAEPRYFNGYVARFRQTGTTGKLARYQAVLVPWLWLLTRTSDCRIYLDRSAVDIIRDVLGRRQFTHFDVRLTATPPVREQCVQYRETDFQFIHRLMEQEGIYYFFEHDNGHHRLVLADSPGCHSAMPGYEQIPYSPPDAMLLGQGEVVWDWAVEQEIQPGGFAHTDYDFAAPRRSLSTASRGTHPAMQPALELFDYPGGYRLFGDGEQYARIRAEEIQARSERITGQTNARGLAAGYTFRLEDPPRRDQDRSYLVTSCEYRIENDAYDDGGTPDAEGPTYTCRFTAIDAREQYRPPRVTPRPIVQGPQTAMVVGPAGEEIHTDEHGRVKLQFHWDRHGQANENSSCWVRVGQNSAGRNWGALSLPRVGQEVIVEFLDGDPDRPIITGRVYNGDSRPPYPLPARKTVSTTKSNSTPGGGGFNEIRLEDKKGQEQLFLHAERNYDLRVEHDAKDWVGRDRHELVKRDLREQAQGDRHTTVDGDWNQKVGGTLSLTTGADLQAKVGQRHALEAGQEIHLKAGMKVILEAGTQLTIKAAGGFVDIGPAGVTIQGTMVKINSGGAAGSGSGASPDSPALPLAADDAEAGSADAPPVAPPTLGTQALALKNAAVAGVPFCAKCEAARRAAEGG